MRKTVIKPLIQLAVVMGLIMVFTNIHALAGYLPGDTGQVNKIYTEGKIPVPPMDPGGTNTGYADSVLGQVIMSGLGYVKVVTVAVGILYLTILGYKMVVHSSNEEELTNVKKGVIYILIAFMIISMSQEIAKVFDYSTGTILQSPSEILKKVRIWDKQVAIIIKFIKYFIAAFAGVMIVRSSIKLITSGGNEEETSKHRHGILYSAAGLLLVYGGDIFINKVFYVMDKNKYTAAKGLEIGVDTGQGVQELVGLTNMAVSFVGPLAMLMLVVAAIMYLAAGGKEENMEKAKRIVIATVIGIAIIYGAFAIVNTIVVGRLSATEAAVTQPTE